MKSSCYKWTRILGSVVPLLVLFSISSNRPVDFLINSAEAQVQKSKKSMGGGIPDQALNAFSKGRIMLEEYGVPFNPNDLLDYRKKSCVLDALKQLPEFRGSEFTEKTIRGVKIADALYLPERVQLSGDTVLIARYLVFEGSDVQIKGNFDLHVFPLQEVGVLGMSPEKAYSLRFPGNVKVSAKKLSSASYSEIKLPFSKGRIHV